nr:putative transporter [Quercus suber]
MGKDSNSHEHDSPLEQDDASGDVVPNDLHPSDDPDFDLSDEEKAAIGMAEAGLFPGVNYYLSCWYKRDELGIRAAVFFSAAALAGSFGGLLAAAIALMRGIGGKPGWAWIFILEGLFTILIGIASYWMVYDFPDDAKFLSSVDRARVIRRLKSDEQSSAEHEEFKMSYFWASVRDWKTWAFAVVYMGCDGALYAFSLFLPSIIQSLHVAGSSSTLSNLLSVPPYAAAAILTVCVGYIADRTHQRGWCNILTSLLGIAGFSMLLGSHTAGVKYAGTFLGALGIYPCIANTITWAANNTEGVYKRGVTLGFVIGWGNLNGVVSSNIYIMSDGPQYRIGHGVVLAYMVLFLLGGSLVTHFLLEKENKIRRAGGRDYRSEGKSRSEIELLGDLRYALFPCRVSTMIFRSFFSSVIKSLTRIHAGLISSTRPDVHI